MLVLIRLMLVLILLPLPVSADDSTRQLLVTFKNENVQYQSAGFQPPYRARKRYAVAASVRRDARAIADEYSLIELEQWPLKSLSVYCYVFEIQSGRSEGVVAALSIDARVDSAQWLNTFQTQSGKETSRPTIRRTRCTRRTRRHPIHPKALPGLHRRRLRQVRRVDRLSVTPYFPFGQ